MTRVTIKGHYKATIVKLTPNFVIIKHEKVKEQIILVRPFAECILLHMFEDPLFLKERRDDKHIQ